MCHNETNPDEARVHLRASAMEQMPQHTQSHPPQKPVPHSNLRALLHTCCHRESNTLMDAVGCDWR